MNIPLNIDWQQILLHLLNFVILAGGLYYLLYKPVKQFMEQREAHYRDMDAQAEQKLAEAEQMKADYQKQMTAAAEELRQQQAEAQQKTQRAVEAELQRAHTQEEQILTEAHAAAEREHKKMLSDVQKELEQMALTATEKLLLSGEDPYEQFLNAVEKEQENG